ncbi:MAG: zinc-binding dehydrogenase [Caldiserica bacterium]|nr:zinc-binding dehydrogenase [Caldisericota bacterium]
MKVAILYGKETLRIEKREIPAPGEGEVLVRIKTALTCGTDAKVYLRGGHPRMITPPSPFGHEFSGEIVKVGKGVDRWKEGMRIMAVNSAPCFSCYYCKREEYSLCEDLLFLNGAYAEYLLIPERIVRYNVYPLPDSLSFAEGAFLEPFACVLHGIEKIGVKTGNWVSVIGCGPIGLLFLLILKAKGTRVIMIDRILERMEKAKELGADLVLMGKEGVEEGVRNITPQKKGVDISIEAVGNPSTWEQSIKLVRKGGKVLLFGGCAPGTSFTLDTHFLHYHEITVKGVFHHTPPIVKRAYEILRDRIIDVQPLITEKLPLEELGKALQNMIKKSGIKTAILP